MQIFATLQISAQCFYGIANIKMTAWNATTSCDHIGHSVFWDTDYEIVVSRCSLYWVVRRPSKCSDCCPNASCVEVCVEVCSQVCLYVESCWRYEGDSSERGDTGHSESERDSGDCWRRAERFERSSAGAGQQLNMVTSVVIGTAFCILLQARLHIVWGPD